MDGHGANASAASVLETQFLDGCDGLRLAADVGGDPMAQAVMLLHGGGQTRHSWGDAARMFIGSGFHVVSLDLRGHGESDWSPGGEYGIEMFARDVIAVASRLSTRPVLVGASLGGLASLIAAGEIDPSLARALVLVDVTPRLNREGAARITGFMSAAPEGFATIDEAADAIARYLPHRPRPTQQSGLMRNLRLRDGRYSWHWDPAFLVSTRSGNPETWRSRYEAAARRITLPTLLVRGSRSEIVSEQAARELVGLIPNAQYADVEGAGHMVAGDMNNAFNTAVSGFLSGLFPAAELQAHG